jgi:predicted HTH domain antitoxin
MHITIADDIAQAAGLSADEVVRELALLLFQQERLTLEGASRLAGLDQLTFQQVLASRQIPMHYDTQEFAADVATLRRLGQL